MSTIEMNVHLTIVDIWLVFNDPNTKDLDKNEATCKNENRKSSIRESIESMSSQGEIGYPIMEETSEL